MSDQQIPQEAPRELTYGEKAVGLTFNPSGDPRVLEIKQKSAALIDSLYSMIDQNGIQVQANEWLHETIRDAISVQMWAVKAVTWRD